jgi:hypothetical protein
MTLYTRIEVGTDTFDPDDSLMDPETSSDGPTVESVQPPKDFEEALGRFLIESANEESPSKESVARVLEAASGYSLSLGIAAEDRIKPGQIFKTEEEVVPADPETQLTASDVPGGLSNDANGGVPPGEPLIR